MRQQQERPWCTTAHHFVTCRTFHLTLPSHSTPDQNRYYTQPYLIIVILRTNPRRLQPIIHPHICREEGNACNPYALPRAKPSSLYVSHSLCVSPPNRNCPSSQGITAVNTPLVIPHMSSRPERAHFGLYLRPFTASSTPRCTLGPFLLYILAKWRYIWLSHQLGPTLFRPLM
jgi:hypothetical protein